MPDPIDREIKGSVKRRIEGKKKKKKEKEKKRKGRKTKERIEREINEEEREEGISRFQRQTIMCVFFFIIRKHAEIS